MEPIRPVGERRDVAPLDRVEPLPPVERERRRREREERRKRAAKPAPQPSGPPREGWLDLRA